MQASKIVVDAVYAVKRKDDTYARFKVSAVITRRERNTGSPHDYKSKVEGKWAEPDAPTDTIMLDPEQILGPYEDYMELVERKRKEDAEEKRKKDEKLAQVVELQELLYTVSGVEKPKDTSHRNYNQPFQIGYSGIDIRKEAVVPLTEALKRLLDNPER